MSEKLMDLLNKGIARKGASWHIYKTSREIRVHVISPDAFIDLNELSD